MMKGGQPLLRSERPEPTFLWAALALSLVVNFGAALVFAHKGPALLRVRVTTGQSGHTACFAVGGDCVGMVGSAAEYAGHGTGTSIFQCDAVVRDPLEGRCRNGQYFVNAGYARRLDNGTYETPLADVGRCLYSDVLPEALCAPRETSP